MSTVVNGSDILAALVEEHVPVDLSKAEMALIIGALLQAERTLPLIDRRYVNLKSLEGLRTQQLSLANRLEDIIADLHPLRPAAGVCPQTAQDRCDCTPSGSASS